MANAAAEIFQLEDNVRCQKRQLKILKRNLERNSDHFVLQLIGSLSPTGFPEPSRILPVLLYHLPPNGVLGVSHDDAAAYILNYLHRLRHDVATLGKVASQMTGVLRTFSSGFGFIIAINPLQTQFLENPYSFFKEVVE